MSDDGMLAEFLVDGANKMKAIREGKCFRVRRLCNQKYVLEIAQVQSPERGMEGDLILEIKWLGIAREGFCSPELAHCWEEEKASLFAHLVNCFSNKGHERLPEGGNIAETIKEITKP